MTLRDIESRERVEFETAADLRKWLNQFSESDLAAVNFYHRENSHLSVYWETEVLTDGSRVYNILL